LYKTIKHPLLKHISGPNDNDNIIRHIFSNHEIRSESTAKKIAANIQNLFTPKVAADIDATQFEALNASTLHWFDLKKLAWQLLKSAL
ncbi:12698_t:CDS:1, partial [Ambispora leptoticha]